MAVHDPAAEPTLPDPDVHLNSPRSGLVVDELVGGSVLLPSLLVAHALLTTTAVTVAIIAISAAVAAVLQAWLVSGWRHREVQRGLLGGLIAPAICTLGHLLALGTGIIAAPQIALVWIAALMVGLLQHIARRSSIGVAGAALIGVQLVQGLTVMAMAWLVQLSLGSDWRSLLSTPAERFLLIGVVVFSLALGWARMRDQRLLNQLHLVGTQLRTYSEWLLGKTLLHRAISDRTVLAPERRERSIMFADIRGFTAWSEMRTPEEVLAMLDHFYQAVETSLMGHEVIKLKYTADEAMVVFANPRTAAIVTLALRDATMTALKPHGLGVGIGLHSGPVIEGLVGGSRHKSFDVLGDTANTAKRICDHATTGEVLISYVFYTACAGKLRIGDERSARAKGKSSALLLSPLAGVLD